MIFYRKYECVHGIIFINYLIKNWHKIISKIKNNIDVHKWQYNNSR